MLHDIRFAIRLFIRRPGVTALTVLTLAAGIAASTTVFTVADAVLWHPVPFRDPSRLVSLWSYSAAQKTSFRGVRFAMVDAWSAKDQILEDVHAYGMRGMILTGDGDAQALTGGTVSDRLFAALGVRPLLGRGFGAEDFAPNGEPVVILSDVLWRSRFAAAADVLGRSLTLDDRRYTIIGVMPPGFVFPVDSVRLWLPLVIDPAQPTGGQAIGRLRPDISMAQAQTVAETTTKNLIDSQGRALPEIRVMPFVHRDPRTVAALVTLLGAVSLLLLIAISNAANVLLAESVRRDGEMAVRASLGASRLQLARQMMTETVLMSGLATALAVAVSSWALTGIVAAMPWILTYQSLRPIALDWRALAFAVAAATLSGVGVALAPIVRARRSDVQSVLKSTPVVGPTHTRLRHALVVAQLAITFVLLAGAGLLANGWGPAEP